MDVDLIEIVFLIPLIQFPYVSYLVKSINPQYGNFINMQLNNILELNHMYIIFNQEKTVL